MKKTVLLLIVSFFVSNIVFGQSTVVHITIAKRKSTSDFLYVLDQPKKNPFSTVLKDSTAAIYTFKLTKPEFVYAYCFSSDDRAGKYFNYLFYLSPGDDIELKADFSDPEFGIKVSGKGSNNNQPLMSAMESVNLHGFFRDSLPNRVINVINDAQRTQQNNFEKYIKLYNPTQSYINDWQTSLNYYACDLYYNFKEENRLYTFDAYYRNLDKWQKINDSLFSTVKLDNDQALGTFHYMQLLTGFLLREKEKFSDEADFHPEAFYRQWYHTDTVNGKKLFNSDRKNLPREMIINRYFTGKTAEFLYAVLLTGAFDEANPANVPEIFERFRQKYPNSEYVAQFSSAVDTVIARQKQALNKKMVFVADNGIKLNSLAEVLAAMKGKTVLVDMWGTWCGPCREEIGKHSASIHEHFNGKNLEYLYIANYDTNNIEQWKKLIAYFDIAGTHMIANADLTKDIMAKVHGQGFPTMFIIKKDGTFELSKSPYPIVEDILIKQLDDALAE